jgi:hypothetical protein
MKQQLPVAACISQLGFADPDGELGFGGTAFLLGAPYFETFRPLAPEG